jgi:hypothetical protein
MGQLRARTKAPMMSAQKKQIRGLGQHRAHASGQPFNAALLMRDGAI